MEKYLSLNWRIWLWGLDVLMRLLKNKVIGGKFILDFEWVGYIMLIKMGLVLVV